MSTPQTKIASLLNTLVKEGRERGLQVAAYLDGKLVLDAWAGVADATTGRPVDGDTLFPVFSVTKGMVATLIHILVQRGQLAYDLPISRLWPEFAAQGKSAITVGQALSHTSGLPLLPAGVSLDVLCDWEAMCTALAGMPTAWPAGTRQVYHAVTFGWILGEVARRATGRTFGQLLEAEICRPLGITDLYCGLPDAVAPRVVRLEEIFNPGKEPNLTDDGQPRDVSVSMLPLHEWMNQPQVRRACVPASNGIASARALARHYAALLPGGVDGVELLPSSRVRTATQRQYPSPITDKDPSMSLGYFIGPSPALGSRASTFGHPGYGGAIGFADPEHRLAVGVTKNLYSPAGASDLIVREIRAALGVPE
ncbi:MAG: serine hydrolase domain-containing protein [Phycisphaerae bacterium]